VPYKWTRKSAVIQHSGTVPATQSGLNLYTPTNPGYSVRQRLNIELSLIAAGASSGTAPLVGSEILCAIGLWAFSGGSVPAASPTPITDSDSPTRWLLWEMLTGELVFNDSVGGQIYIRWTYDGLTDQTRSKFTYAAGTDCSVWLAWEFLDPAGIINATLGGAQYSLGGMYALAALDHYT